MGQSPGVDVQPAVYRFHHIGHKSFLAFPELYLFLCIPRIPYRAECPLPPPRAGFYTQKEKGR
jgi:hypothetical protein